MIGAILMAPPAPTSQPHHNQRVTALAGAESARETMATINETTDLASVELDNNKEEDDDVVSEDEEEDDVVAVDDDEDDDDMNIDSEDEIEEDAKEVTDNAFKQIS